MRRSWIMLIALTWLPNSHAVAQSSRGLRIFVRDSTGPLPEALVTVMPHGFRARTDAQGVAAFDRVDSGRVTISVRRLGYTKITYSAVVGAGVDSLAVHLSPLAVALTGVVIEDAISLPWLQEFDERRRRGTGRYVTLAEMRQSHGSDLDAILRRRVPGLRIGGPNALSQFAYSTRGTNSIQGGCKAAVYIDGIREPQGNAAAMPLSLLGAIEYYTPSQVPVQYRAPQAINPRTGVPEGGSPGCGVLLLWTR